MSRLDANEIHAGPRNWAWVFGEVVSLRWVLDNHQMAFGTLTPRAPRIGLRREAEGLYQVPPRLAVNR